MNNIRHVIWDLDGVLFPYDAPCVQAIIAGIANTIPTIQPSINTKQAFDIAKQSQEKYQNCFTSFVTDHGFAFEPLVKTVFEQIDISQMMQPNPEFIAALEQSPADHIILTRSSMDWALRATTQLGLQHIFTENRIIACDNDPAMAKDKSVTPFQRAITQAGFQAHVTAMVEDTVKNLKYAKELGLHTVLIAPEPQKHGIHDFIDAVHATPTGFLNAFSL